MQNDNLPISKKELHLLLEDKDLNSIPILIVGNKIDVKPHLSESEIITGNSTIDYRKILLIISRIEFRLCY